MLRSMLALSLGTLISLGFATSAFAQATGAAGATHPCEQIEQQCKAAGFVYGQAAEGTGLWADCVDPIMRATAQPTKAKIKLPSVDPSLVAACKAKHPNFGEGKKK